MTLNQITYEKAFLGSITINLDLQFDYFNNLHD
jgi:hypothetical protein